MATEKNITMKQFNGTDYDTLYPKTIASQIPDVYSKTNTITAETLSQLGLSADKLPNDAFQQIKTLIDNVQTSTDSKARIQIGSYVGTGTYGANNPCSLTFDFEPEFVFVLRYNSAISPFYAHDSSTQAHTDCMIWLNKSSCEMNESSTNISSFDESTNTLSWYIENPGNYIEALMQLNLSGETFKYIAVG